MAAGSTYTPIATTTLSSNAATVTFSSIPSTYTDIVLQATMLQNGTATATNGYITLNSSATGYSRTGIQGSGTVASSYRNTGMDKMYFSVDSNATDWAFHTHHFMNYANTSIYKTVLSRQNNAATLVGAVVFIWQNTAAINSIAITASDNQGAGTADQFVAGTTFTLYGISAA
jgi:hypothetical protein